MAIKTTFELFDIVTNTADLHINATDIDGNTQTIISAPDSRRYITRKYGTRYYSVLTGSYPATSQDATLNFIEDFTLWIKNRQHNIDRQYQALFDYDYSPIENVDRHETETINRDLETKYGRTDTKSGTDTTQYGRIDTLSGEDETTYGRTDTLSGEDETTYGRTDTLSGEDETTYGKVETNGGTDTVTLSGTDTNTKNGTHETVTEKAGFNAPNSYTNAEKVTETFTDYEEETDYGKVETTVNGHTVTESGSDTIEYGKTNTQSGSDTVSYGKVNTQGGSDTIDYGKTNTASGSDSFTHGEKNTQGGTDTTDDDTSRTLWVHGNIGVTRSDELVAFEIETRKLCLAEILLDNFINDYTYYS